MNAYSEDLRMKIVEELERWMGKSQAARTFSVSLSSVKRYCRLAEEGRSLAPKKRPGSKPKREERSSRLLEEDLRERPLSPCIRGANTELFVHNRLHCNGIGRSCRTATTSSNATSSPWRGQRGYRRRPPSTPCATPSRPSGWRAGRTRKCCRRSSVTPVST